MISSDNDHPEIRPRFWKRQFLGPATTPQIIFDVVFGIVGPVLCFVFDPVVFRGDFLSEPLYADYQLFAYLVSSIEISVLQPGSCLETDFLTAMD